MITINQESAAGKLISDHAGTLQDDGKTKKGGSVIWDFQVYAVEDGAVGDEVPAELTEAINKAMESAKKKADAVKAAAERKEQAQAQSQVQNAPLTGFANTSIGTVKQK